MFHKFPKFTLLLVAALLLGACASSLTPVADPQPDSVADPELVADPEPEEETFSGGDVASATGTLVIYSGRSESLVGPIIQQFAEVSGINVQVRYGSTSEMAAALLEEDTNSPADIFFAQDPGGLGAVDAAGLFAELPDDILSRVDAFYAAPDGRWVGVSGRARVVVYNTERLQASDLPNDLMGFTDPSWSGRLGIAPGNGSFQTMITGMRQLWGEEETHDWLHAIVDNNPTYYENNTSIVAAVAAGEVDAGLVNHYYLYRFLAEEGEDFPARNHYMADGGPGSLVMVAGAGRLSNGENEANALRFLSFLLSPVAQQYFASQTYEYPLVEGVATSSLLTPLSDLNPPQIALGNLSDLQGTVALLQEVGMLP